MCRLARRNLLPSDSACQSGSFASGREGNRGKSMVHSRESSTNKLGQ